ncbi:uncharacterized protein LOC109710978 isoform X1 [Ananas comosus]|uniref:Uncharacterized protein LOC109710978 isoform X1 n=1 Tax=Ananas comosus TaxID=4615 RepID=A0A6P5EZV0_ANACO|nr:uncharacterized protein LOC109710978 isoform X1 [Ananas comosus]
MKSQRNFSRTEAKRVGNVTIILAIFLSLCVLSIIKSHFAPYAVKSDEPVVFEEERKESLKIEKEETKETAETADSAAIEDEDDEAETETKAKAEAQAQAVDLSKPTCYESSRRSDTCEAAGDVRVQGRTQTVYIQPLAQEWKIKPYCRKHDAFALSHVKEWTLKPFSAARPPPPCTRNHSATAMIFSNGGFTGNLFHDYTDVLVPVFISSFRYDAEVQFLVSSLKPWWISKYLLIFQQLSKYDIIDVDNDDEVHCFPRAVVGPTFHKELGVDAGKTAGGYSAADFRKLLRRAFGLERAAAAPSGDQWDIRRRPRLLIISRKNSRTFLNERAMVDMATSLGFDVRVGEPDINTDVAKFARLVNSADVMVGAHGAGLTNMVFLPAGAVLIQIVPFGGLEWLARGTFQEPAKDMEIHYIEYKIRLDETTLSEQYHTDHPVLKDPFSVHKQGWDALKTVYLDKQNLRPHLGRLKNTLLEALRLLPHSHSH